MRSNQILMLLFVNGTRVKKVVNMDQVKFAEIGDPVQIDQLNFSTTILTMIDNSQETALVDFEQYQAYFTVTDIMLFDSSLIPIQS